MNRQEALEKALEAARGLRSEGVGVNFHKRPPKDDSDLENHYRVEFYPEDDGELERIFRVEELLLEERISFDSGYDVVEDRRDWELDWSLRVV